MSFHNVANKMTMLYQDCVFAGNTEKNTKSECNAGCQCRSEYSLNRLGLTQEIGTAREEGTVLLPGPAVVLILWNDFTKS